MTPIGAIWAAIWNTAIWDTSIWSQEAAGGNTRRGVRAGIHSSLRIGLRASTR